jgi:small subunit ribosomal protein S5
MAEEEIKKQKLKKAADTFEPKAVPKVLSKKDKLKETDVDEEVEVKDEFSSRKKGKGRKGGDRSKPRRSDAEDGLIDRVVHINRCAKVVKGGRRFSFSALVVVGDAKGKVGYGFGKANEVAEAIRKGLDRAKRSLMPVILSGATIPHQVIGTHKGAKVLLKPACPGTGIIAGGGVRAIVERAGIRDILTKSLGSKNALNVVKATVNALNSLRSVEMIESLRGVSLPKQEFPK